jgi:hypothetical protein
MNLDADGASERFVATYDVSSDHKYELAQVVIVDSCGGNSVRHQVVRPGKRLSAGDVYGPAALGRRGVLFAIGYGGRAAVARVVRLHAGPTMACPLPQMLFRYETNDPPVAPPPGMVVRNFDVVPREASTRYPGRELLLVEHYGRATGDELARRETLFGFRGGRYVSYHSRLRRNPPPPARTS